MQFKRTWVSYALAMGLNTTVTTYHIPHYATHSYWGKKPAKYSSCFQTRQQSVTIPK